jgi:hypothetical protein
MPWLKSMTGKGLKRTFTFLARWALLAIELFRKVDNNWSLIDYEPGSMVELASVKLTFPIEQVYEDVEFPPENIAES